ncbi:MAG: hypothetical protein GY847_34325, partial [Proteobacteria bacterium]|nr:hypothetical protein [Pseudomonadota bacterium]
HGHYDCCSYDGECYDEHCGDNCCIPFEMSVWSCRSPARLLGLMGNAAEYVLDWRDESGGDHSWCANGCTDPEPRTGELPILKGGGVALSFYSVGDMTRISARFVPMNERGGNYIGVRCVRPAGQQSDAGVDGEK